jgi:malonate-semialdehyde dehydrogenase (acetylating)/methylmalonate-semialdehyde dehydrogenase
VAVMPDADLDQGMPSLLTSFFGCTGQRCLSGSVLVPVADIADRLVEPSPPPPKTVSVGDGWTNRPSWGP